MRSCGIEEQEGVNFYLSRGRQIGQTPPRHLLECDECYAWAEAYYGEERAELFFSQKIRKLLKSIKEHDFELTDKEFEILNRKSHSPGWSPNSDYRALIERMEKANVPISEYL